MSVTVALYEYDESMDEKVLESMGVRGGLIGKLSQSDISIEEERKVLDNTASHMVGESSYDFPRRILDEVQGVTEIDEVFIQTVKAASTEIADEDEGRYSAKETVNWIEERKGEKIFSQAL